MSPPRVLYLLHQFGDQTGVELHTQMLEQGLSDRYEVSIAWPTSGGVHLLQGNTRRTFSADPPVWPKSPYRAERTAQALDEIFRIVRPDLIHIQHFLNWPLGVIDQAVDSRARVVVSFHDHFALSPQYALRGTEAPGETLTSAYGVKTFGEDISPWLRERREVLRRSLERVDALVTVSPYLERQLAAVFPATYRQIEYGIVGFQPLPKVPAAKGLRFGFLGQLVPQKGWESLVAGFAEVRRRHPDVELHLYGGTRLEAPPGVHFHGFYEARELAGICARLDVGVVPSVFAETYCMVLSELWQGGLPVAAAEIGALRDRVIDNVNGKKFAPGDPADIARALSWFAENAEWRQWQLPRPRLAPQMVAEYDQLYQELLGRERPPSRLPAEISAEQVAMAMLPTAIHADAPACVTTPSSSGIHTDGIDTSGLLIVQSCGFSDDGDGVYRVHSPSRALSRLEGVTVVDCHPYHRCLPELQEQADVLVLSSFDHDIFPLLEKRRAAGRVTVLEANDYYFDVHPWNKAANLWLNRSVEDGFSHLLRMADGVQTSTPELARRWRERTDRPVAVFRNQLADVPPLPPALSSPVRSRPITIGWGGSYGHLADWYQLAPALQAWLDAQPDVQLAVMIGGVAKPFLRLPPERYHFQPFGTLAEYYEFLDRLDIGLAPLLPTDYNRCRTDVKFLEYASRGVVGVYADLEPYHDSVEHGRTGFLYRSHSELFACLDTLVADARLREGVRQEAYAHVAQERRLEQHIGERLTFYRELLGRVRRARHSNGRTASATRCEALSSDVRDLAVCDGRYLQLRPQAPELVLATAIESPSTRESAAALTRLVEQHPDYGAALQQLGTTLNDLHESDAALPYLERSRQLQPLAADPLCQLARLYHQKGQLLESRQLLETAIDLNPYSPRPWHYLLRLLPVMAAAGSGGPVDGRPWAERARQLHPASCSLALLGAHLYPPDEALALLEQLLDTYVPQLRADDVAAVALFSVTIGAIAGPILDRPHAVALVQHAAAVFPQSVRLSDLLARALAQQGQRAAAHAESVRGQQLRRAALCYRAEFPKEDETVPLRQIAEHVLLMEESSGKPPLSQTQMQPWTTPGSDRDNSVLPPGVRQSDDAGFLPTQFEGRPPGDDETNRFNEMAQSF